MIYRRREGEIIRNGIGLQWGKSLGRDGVRVHFRVHRWRLSLTFMARWLVIPITTTHLMGMPADGYQKCTRCGVIINDFHVHGMVDLSAVGHEVEVMWATIGKLGWAGWCRPGADWPTARPYIRKCKAAK